ncbi:MAG: hypothetical protein V4585_16465 [Bacteroidota bacterium]
MKINLKLLVTLPALVLCSAMVTSVDEITELGMKHLKPLSSISVPTDAKDLCPVTAAEFNQIFETGTVTLDGLVKPANSVTFPDIPNCSFYKWTEQMFLWATSKSSSRYGGGSRIFDSPKFFEVSPPASDGSRSFIRHVPGTLIDFHVRTAQKGPNKLPVVVQKGTGKLFEIAPQKISLNNMLQLKTIKDGDILELNNIRKLDVVGKKLILTNTLTNNKTFVRPLPTPQKLNSSILNKFTVNNVNRFFDVNGNEIVVETGQAGDGEALEAQNGSLIYYITLVNEVYAYQRTMLGASVPNNTSFPTTQAQLDAILAFATSKGVTVTDPEALAIELKSSWIEADGLPDLNTYITMDATIPTYDKTNPANWVVNGKKTVKLAMVGMHVVGSTKGHPEMIWGTFEHLANTPNTAYSYVNSSNATINVPQSTAGNWLFCSNNSAGPFNEAHMANVSNNIQASPPFLTVSPSNTLRTMPWGMPGNSANSNTQVIAMNNNTQSRLIDGDVRKNYIQTGSTWTIFGAAPNGSNQVGTNKLANSTMETYQIGSNCFSCHVTNKVNVSHVFTDLKPLQ